jgi:Ni,Fe-hydrogenase I cytochrome b subunit
MADHIKAWHLLWLWVIINFTCVYVYCDIIFCQMETMKVELERAVIIMKKSDAKIKYLEDSKKKVYNNMFI